jgi:hypothetical protein
MHHAIVAVADDERLARFNASVIALPAPVRTPAIIEPAAVSAQPSVEVLPPRKPLLPSIMLKGSAVSVAATGVVINGWYDYSLGSTELAARLFLVLGVACGVAGLILPTWAAIIWPSWRSLVAWCLLWPLTLVFALTSTIGFAGVNIADTRLSRTMATNPMIEADQRELADVERIRDQECRKVGPICQQRRDEVVRKQNKRDEDQRKIVADPQSDSVAKLVEWTRLGKPSPEDYAMFRLLLISVLPHIGGLLLMVARR